MIASKLRSKRVRLALALVLVGLLLVTGVALAGPANFSLDWNVVAGGGGTLSGGGYSLSGTMGQGTVYQTMSGGNMTLTGGFWAGMPSSMEYFPAIKK